MIKAKITSNKLQKFEAVSKLWKRHRSHHIQNVVPNVMARHQLLDTTQAIGTFPITKISPGSVRKSHLFSDRNSDHAESSHSKAKG